MRFTSQLSRIFPSLRGHLTSVLNLCNLIFYIATGFWFYSKLESASYVVMKLILLSLDQLGLVMDQMRR